MTGEIPEDDIRMIDPVVHIRITDDPDGRVAAADSFLAAWKRGEAGETRTEVHLGYDSVEALARLLTAERMALLHHLKREPAGDVLSLSRSLHRRLPLVESDVEALLDAGLLHRRDGRLQPVAGEITLTITL